MRTDTVLAGQWRADKLHYVGRSRTSGDIGDLRERLLAIETEKMSFVRPHGPTLEGGEVRPPLVHTAPWAQLRSCRATNRCEIRKLTVTDEASLKCGSLVQN